MQFGQCVVKIAWSMEKMKDEREEVKRMLRQFEKYKCKNQYCEEKKEGLWEKVFLQN